jgi:hypothetical protein
VRHFGDTVEASFWEETLQSLHGAPRGAPFLCAVAALAVIRAASEHSLHRHFNQLAKTTKFRTKMVSSAARPVRPVASEPFGQALHNFAE